MAVLFIRISSELCTFFPHYSKTIGLSGTMRTPKAHIRPIPRAKKKMLVTTDIRDKECTVPIPDAL